MRARRAHLRRGFTLIELLVVIAIIALLLALALGQLRSSRRAAVHTVCRSNIRSAGMVINAYTAAYKDFYPFGGYEPRYEKVPEPQGATVGGPGGLALGTWACLFEDEWQGGYWSRGLCCPKQPRVRASESTGLEVVALFPLYRMSQAFWIDPRALALAAPKGKDPVRPAKAGDVRFPSLKALLYEHRGYCIDEPARAGVPVDLDSGEFRTSVVFADGSVRRLSRKYDALPSPRGAFDGTIDGVLGRDVP